MGKLIVYSGLLLQQAQPLAFVTHDGRQPGDPVKAAKAVVDITEVAERPLRLALGADAVARIEDKLDLVRRELDQWRHLALSVAV